MVTCKYSKSFFLSGLTLGIRLYEAKVIRGFFCSWKSVRRSL